jgi:hypothetical protein
MKAVRLEISGVATIALSTYLDKADLRVSGPILLRPDEGIILRVQT